MSETAFSMPDMCTSRVCSKIVETIFLSCVDTDVLLDVFLLDEGSGVVADVVAAAECEDLFEVCL